MAATYRKAETEVTDVLNDILSEHYHALVEAGVTIEVLTAHASVDKNDDPVGPALKLHGYPCAGIVKINSLKDRVAGCADARIIVDGDEWPAWNDTRRRSVLHHEAHHLDLVRGKEGEVVTDDAGRPKLKMRLHSWQLGGFAVIAKQYGEQAFEVEGFREVAHEYRQLLLPWMDPMRADEEEAGDEARELEAAVA